MTPTILIVFGTRPEAIKMAPVIGALRARPEVHVKVCVTGQHREMLDQVLALFGIRPDFDLRIMRTAQSLTEVTSAILLKLERVIEEISPQMVVVHGDTTTTFVGALSAFYQRLPVAHIEAGLRTWKRYAPWPEELNRRLTGCLASLHFAPTESAKCNLLKEGIEARFIEITGNTVIDALLTVVKRLDSDEELRSEADKAIPELDDDKKLVVVTGHRRENFGKGFENLCNALTRISERSDVEIIYPVHLNPNVWEPVNGALGQRQNIRLIEPLEYLPFIRLLQRSYLIITDSGGVQEEAPSLGKPVICTREKTERPEAVEAGTVLLVGTDENLIVKEVSELLQDERKYEAMAKIHNPYGDGNAAGRIAQRIIEDIYAS